MEEKGWERIRGRLPKTHEWVCTLAKRNKKKGRAKRGSVIGRRKEWGEGGEGLIKYEEEGWVFSEVGKEGKRVGIVSIYNTGKWKEIEDGIDRLTEDRERDEIIIGGDFNIRTGRDGGIGVDEEGNKRFSKDKIIGNEGRNLIE